MYEHRIKHLEEMHRVLDKQVETLERIATTAMGT